jgi:hypothetical protein
MRPMPFGPLSSDLVLCGKAQATSPSSDLHKGNLSSPAGHPMTLLTVERVLQYVQAGFVLGREVLLYAVLLLRDLPYIHLVNCQNVPRDVRDSLRVPRQKVPTWS